MWPPWLYCPSFVPRLGGRVRQRSIKFETGHDEGVTAHTRAFSNMLQVNMSHYETLRMAFCLQSLTFGINIYD